MKKIIQLLNDEVTGKTAEATISASAHGIWVSVPGTRPCRSEDLLMLELRNGKVSVQVWGDVDSAEPSDIIEFGVDLKSYLADLKKGDLVYWVDPDDGQGSGVYQLLMDVVDDEDLESWEVVALLNNGEVPVVELREPTAIEIKTWLREQK